MLKEEKVIRMTKLAVYENNEGKKTLPVSAYHRWDYVSLQLVRTFIYSSIGYVLVMGTWIVYSIEQGMDIVRIDQLRDLTIHILIGYLLWEILFLIITFIVYNIRYTKSFRSLKVYYNHLKKLNEFYKEEKDKTSESF